MKKTTSAPSLIDTLEKLKTYTEFESVTVGADGSVSVKFAGKQAAPQERRKTKAEPEKQTAIDSLTKTPPDFRFEA